MKGHLPLENLGNCYRFVDSSSHGFQDNLVRVIGLLVRVTHRGEKNSQAPRNEITNIWFRNDDSHEFIVALEREREERYDTIRSRTTKHSLLTNNFMA